MVYALLQSQQGSPVWELTKGVMLTLTTAGVAFTVKTIFGLRDEVRTLTSIVCGSDGKNGLRSDVRRNSSRLDSVENRNRELDAISRRERELYKGPERREETRRGRDTYPISGGEG